MVNERQTALDVDGKRQKGGPYDDTRTVWTSKTIFNFNFPRNRKPQNGLTGLLGKSLPRERELPFELGSKTALQRFDGPPNSLQKD